MLFVADEFIYAEQVRVERSCGTETPPHPVWSKNSCGSPVVVLQEAAQSLFAAHSAIEGTHSLFSCWKEQNIFFTLMVSFLMVVLGERRYRSPQ